MWTAISAVEKGFCISSRSVETSALCTFTQCGTTALQADIYDCFLITFSAEETVELIRNAKLCHDLWADVGV
jgi:hypothetical protein